MLCNTSLITLSLLGVTDDDWKKVSGVFSTVIACPLTCRSQQSYHGMSPWAHQANGCTDLILVRQSSKMELVKWLLRQRRTMNSVRVCVCVCVCMSVCVCVRDRGGGRVLCHFICILSVSYK